MYLPGFTFGLFTLALRCHSTRAHVHSCLCRVNTVCLRFVKLLTLTPTFCLGLFGCKMHVDHFPRDAQRDAHRNATRNAKRDGTQKCFCGHLPRDAHRNVQRDAQRYASDKTDWDTFRDPIPMLRRAFPVHVPPPNPPISYSFT